LYEAHNLIIINKNIDSIILNLKFKKLITFQKDNSRLGKNSLFEKAEIIFLKKNIFEYTKPRSNINK
jgi:hypothetical protein